MKWKANVPLIAAVLFGLAAALVARSMMADKTAAPPAQVVVVIADKPISPGQIIQQDDLDTIKVPQTQATEGTIADPQQIAGRAARVAIAARQPILNKMLADNGASGLAALVPDGMRAITVDVNEATGVAGLLSPGCHVDLLASLSNKQGTSITTRAIAQDLRVLAIGQTLAAGKPAPDESTAQSVTLLVTPRQAEAIDLASSITRPRLILRAGNDRQPDAAASLTLSQLLDEHFTPVLAHTDVAPSPRTVEIIRGGVRSVVEFPAGPGIASPVAAPRVAGGKMDAAPIAPEAGD